LILDELARHLRDLAALRGGPSALYVEPAAILSICARDFPERRGNGVE
jgi:hypothetical protein